MLAKFHSIPLAFASWKEISSVLGVGALSPLVSEDELKMHKVANTRNRFAAIVDSLHVPPCGMNGASL